MDLYSNSSKNISRIIRNRYVLALSIIVFLLILSQIIIQHNISNESYASRVINISGRQRMLSQRISKDAYGIFISEDEKTRLTYIEELKKSTDLWKESQLDLKNGDKDKGLPGDNSKKVIQLFSEIEGAHQAMLRASYEIIDIVQRGSYDKEQLWNRIKTIKDNEPLFLNGMDAIVFQYDTESKDKINFIRKIEALLLLLTFSTIILEVFFIFLPAEKSIEKTFTELKESRENLHKLFETAPVALLLVNDDLSVILQNKFAKEMVVPQVPNIENLKLDKIFDCGSNVSCDLFSKIKYNEKTENQEAILKLENSNKVVLISSIKIYFNNKPSILLGLSDITRQKEVEEILKRFATYDELTGLVNRRSGWLILENIYEKAKAGLIDFSICFIDIDGLKSVNDTYGHDEGDWYIKTVANVFDGNIDKNNCVFRYGGDEILIILTNYNNLQANSFMKEIEKKLKKIQVSQSKSYPISISYGIVNFRDHKADTLEDYVRKADYFMYENKKLKKATR